jgi:urease accessory protein
MVDDVCKVLSIDQGAAPRSWLAQLDLSFNSNHLRTWLEKKQHIGPLVIQKTLYPEGADVCHGVIVHPPGGVAGGDQLTLNVNLVQRAHVLLTTPGAGKWYKANGSVASQHLAFEIKDDACYEWLPQENILFNGSKVRFSAQVNLSRNAKYAGWDIMCFGRQAQGERWDSGELQQSMIIRREGKLIWNEHVFLDQETPLLQSIIGLGGNAVNATFVIAAHALPTALLNSCRDLQPNLTIDGKAKYGVTALPEIFVARYVGQSAQSARHYFEQLWMILRPWYGQREAARPRIWNT